MSTAEDIRILFVERVVANLIKQLGGTLFGSPRKLAPLWERAREMGKLVTAMRYSYLDDALIREMPEQERLRAMGAEIVAALEAEHRAQRDKLALLRFYRLTFGQFREAFGLEPELPSAVAVEVGEVGTVSRHPKAKMLVLCRVQVFGERLEIVTNLKKTRPGQRMRVAMVLPAEVMGVLSEAQFVGWAQEGEQLGARPALGEHERAEIRKTMGAYLDAAG
ncbi:MAG: hypothetical protein JXR96_30740 [Deltaproteobacteria bacterium]|nr:hypothetical protein [Deltaproteobacteria bacterium]